MLLPKLVLAALLLLPGLRAAAQALDPTFASPASLYATSTVFALGPQQADGKRLLASNATRVNGAAYGGTLVRLNATGATDATFTQNVGASANVFRIKAFANGQYLLGSLGGPLLAGGLARTEVLRLNADGTADATFDAGPGPAMTNDTGRGYDYAAQPDGKVLVVGYFDSFSGTTANGVARLNTSGNLDASFATGTGIGGNAANGLYAEAVAVQPDGKILVGGTFATFNGAPVYGLVRLLANGSVDASFATPFGASSEATAVVVQPDGKILVSGLLHTSTSSAGLVRLNANGSLDTSFASTFGGGYASTGFDPPLVLQADGKIVVVGGFTTLGGGEVARLHANGSLDTSFTLSVGYSGTPYNVGVQADGKILVSGNFAGVGGTELALARLTTTGSLDASFAPKLQRSGTITAVVRQPDGQLVVGGSFTEYSGVAVHQVARVSATGTLDAGFATASGMLPGSVNCLALQADGKVLAGTGAGLVRLTASGAPDAGFAAPLVGSATALAVQADGRILVGGPFGGIAGGVAFSNLARLTTTGAFDPTFARPVTTSFGTATSTSALLVQPDGRIVVAGRFAPTGQASTVRVVRYESTGALDATFAPTTAFTGPGAQVYALARQPDGQLLVGGSFSAAGGSPHVGVARLSATGTVDAAFSSASPLAGVVYALGVQPNGRVLLGGSFSAPSAAGLLVHLARVLPDGSTDATFRPTALPNASVRQLLVQPDGAIVLAGNFTSIDGQPALGLARLTAANVLAVAAPAAVAIRTQAWPVPAHGLLHIAPDPAAQPQGVALLDALGRAVRQQALGSAAEVTLSTAGLPAGVYLLRVQYAAGTATRRVVVD